MDRLALDVDLHPKNPGNWLIWENWLYYNQLREIPMPDPLRARYPPSRDPTRNITALSFKLK